MQVLLRIKDQNVLGTSQESGQMLDAFLLQLIICLVDATLVKEQHWSLEMHAANELVPKEQGDQKSEVSKDVAAKPSRTVFT
mmetsp:Transcript_70365/g.124267  ORF Transcript_70365/g.124267 Transcript_70365/m.124267 type:complete len:82 (+) Transcript_70365:129-374(+)